MINDLSSKITFVSAPKFSSSDNNNDSKTLSIPIKSKFNQRNCASSLGIKKNQISPTRSPEILSKSWNGQISRSPIYEQTLSRTGRLASPLGTWQTANKFKPYDAINNCKSAGIIPYTIHGGEIYFLLQKIDNPVRKKDSGWNDFGGKQLFSETTAEIAAREFSEETSCLFYLKDNESKEYNEYYELLKDNQELQYDDPTIELLKNLIQKSQKFYTNKITEYVLPLYISSKETYISYFVKVCHIPEIDLPRAEDIHVAYEYRYIRTCKWFSLNELLALNEKDFHKRLQITRIQQRIINYFSKEMFT